MNLVNRQQKGKEAELAACRFLQGRGLLLLTQNYRCYHGEIDLIMKDKDDIVFVEVRSRYRRDFGTAIESINRSKVKKLIKTATHFLQVKQWLDRLCSRFDVIGVQTLDGRLEIEWIKNAFSPE